MFYRLMPAFILVIFSLQVHAVELAEDGLHVQPWFKDSFLELADDLDEAKAEGKRLAIIIEQRGCTYCARIHEEVLTSDWVADYIKENFEIIQLNMFGERIVTDLDGTEMAEKDMVMRWGVLFTPTIIFFPENYDSKKGGTLQDQATAIMPGAFGRYTFRNMFEWVATRSYETQPNFQKFHAVKFPEYKAEGLGD